MKEVLEKSKGLSRAELEKMKIELEAKAQLFATTIGLVNCKRYSPV